jgi:hypothetical protein
MSVSHAPRLATWLLKRMASGPKRESMIGDLIEQYQRERSCVWYWRQVLTAILVGVVHDTRDHKRLAARALVAYFVLIQLFGFLGAAMYHSVGILMWNWTVVHGFDTLRVMWFGHPPFPPLPMFLIESINAATIGWIIAWFHRDHAPAIVLTCAVFISLFQLAFGFWFVGLSEIFRVHPVSVVVLLNVPLSTVFGGVLFSRPAIPDPRARAH